MSGNDLLRGEVFNFSTDEPFTVLEITNAILKAMKSGLKPEIMNEASNEIREQHLRSAKARKILGWKPKFTFEEAMKKTISWYTDFLKK